MSLGSTVSADGRGVFRVWAADAEKVALKLEGESLEMDMAGDGLFEREVQGAREGMRYCFSVMGMDLPDPVSRFQPDGVHGRSALVDPSSFSWADADWEGPPIKDYVIYELHVGTFTEQGTFDAIIPQLEYLKELGITALELMPVGQFPGERNWGYDGVCCYAPQNSYGGPDGLKRLVDACHRKGLAVILDVVYNHVGPEGNYLSHFGPYFTDRYKTPWGPALNYDGPYSHWVRRYVIENALYWITEYHIDALRLDAIHGIFDFSPKHVLEEMAERVKVQADALCRRIYLIAESDLNDPRFVRGRERCGCGIDAQWLDDFHHSLHTTLTGERAGYYNDFAGIKDLVKSIREGFVYGGEYSQYRKKPFGAPSKDLPCEKFVVFSQNHDQIGNRMHGERFCHLVPLEGQKLAAAAVILSPYIPLLFMGEEYAEESPFLYFVSHSDLQLIEAVRKGRREEFKEFNWGEDLPDPQDPETFGRSRLHLEEGRNDKPIFRWYRDLLRLRKEHPSLRNFEHKNVKANSIRKVLVMERTAPGEERALIIMSFDGKSKTIRCMPRGGGWKLLLSSDSKEYGGVGGTDGENGGIDRRMGSISLGAYGVYVYVSGGF